MKAKPISSLLISQTHKQFVQRVKDYDHHRPLKLWNRTFFRSRKISVDFTPYVYSLYRKITSNLQKRSSNLLLGRKRSTRKLSYYVVWAP